MTETAQKITFAQAINMAMDEAMAADPRVLLFGEDIADAQGGGVWKVTAGLSAKYGTQRVRSTPIAEQAIVGAAVGAAIAGFRPVAEIMLMNFITVAMDQLVNHAAKLRFMSGGQTSVPLTIRTASGAGRGFGGQHSDMLESWFAHVPGLKVVTSSTPAEAKGLLLSCIEDPDPCIFIENSPSYRVQGEAPTPGFRVPLCKANVVRKGRDITVIGYGRPIGDAVAVADALETRGISVEVIDLRTIAPFDIDTVLNSVGKTKRALIIHEAVRNFGVGAEISSRIHEELFGELRAPCLRLGSKFCPVPFSPALEKDYLLGRGDIEAAILSTLNGKKAA
jgi:acetoin:2,6-dichlorophenolindophenol oxidoreductase subunit beta